MSADDLTKRRLTIEAKEPPPNRVIDVMAHNDLVRATGDSDEEKADINWRQRVAAYYGYAWDVDSLHKRG